MYMYLYYSLSLAIYKDYEILPFPNLARIDWGASERAKAESVGPRVSLQDDIQPSPISSKAMTGPLVTKFRRVLDKKIKVSKCQQRPERDKISVLNKSE